MTAGPIVHWFDFICPFCYIAQDRNRILRSSGHKLVELPLQIHPEIGPGGAAAPSRDGGMYSFLAEQAREAGLELEWSSKIPYSANALAAAELVRTTVPEAHLAFTTAVFDAYFAHGRDIEDPAVIAECGSRAGLDPSFAYPSAPDAVAGLLAYGLGEAERLGVNSTPSWLVYGRVVGGLYPRAAFAALP
ncbi:DsbA family protein [Actinoplanes sp. TBRC 11911]|uniref:DsbA family oxidoreductase n=1 Tax=Actinoplanes sp. TBRC 11911 TaxID=2729386 RepID=UPI00145E4CEE|nr:DsbA family protein [Actinoplanes sp. TBRC 11911]NMO52401.1 DsbA family protein [Actinoplanes sp. TBRC 11911]